MPRGLCAVLMAGRAPYSRRANISNVQPPRTGMAPYVSQRMLGNENRASGHGAQPPCWTIHTSPNAMATVPKVMSAMRMMPR